MSTRCQVKVVQEGMGWEQARTLYHHCDGYPSNMLQLIQDAKKMNLGWESGRAGKAASFLCASDPGQFEPEEGHELHGDIEWYYVVHCVNNKGGSCGDEPKWLVDVFDVYKSMKNPVAEKVDIMSLSANDMIDIEKGDDE